MNASDYDDTNSLYPTSFDEQKLLNMSIGDTIDAESGAWRVFKYKDSYSLLLMNNVKNKEMSDFDNLFSLITFLKKS